MNVLSIFEDYVITNYCFIHIASLPNLNYRLFPVKLSCVQTNSQQKFKCSQEKTNEWKRCKMHADDVYVSKFDTKMIG